MACSAVLVCSLINLSLIQFAAGDSDIYEELKLAKDEKEVEAIFKNAPYKRQHVVGDLDVEYMEKMSSPSLDADQCEPVDIQKLASLVSDEYLPKSLQDYLNHHFPRLIRVCVENIENLFARDLPPLEYSSEIILNYFEDPSNDEELNTYDLDQVADLCKTVLELNAYVENMNLYEKLVPIEEELGLFGEWWDRIDTCEKVENV